MSVDAEPVEDVEALRRRRRWQGIVAPFLVTSGVVALALGGLWIERAPIAENLIQRELAARNVRMDYRVASIGLRTQRIEDIVLGDPARPDLTAQWIEVDIALVGITPRVAAVRAGGVRLRGRYQDGKLALGELDKFLGQGGSTETLLPDIRVGLSDARATMATDYGMLGAVLDGSGNLRDRFVGRAVLAMPRPQGAGCAGQRVLANLWIRMRSGAPRISGPVTADALACPARGLALAAPRIDVDAKLDRHLANLEGRAQLAARALRGGGMTLGELAGTLDGQSDDKGYRGKLRVTGGTLSGRGLIAGGSELALRFQGVGGRIGADGTLGARDLAMRGRDPLAGLTASTAGTPVAPLVAKLGDALRAAGRGNRLDTALALRNEGDRAVLNLSALRFAARSGARIAMAEGGSATFGLPDGRWGLSGTLTTRGGGLPEAVLALEPGQGGGVAGRLSMQPYAAGTARLALAPVRFSAAPGGASRFDTHMVLDGPLADGAVKGLSVPLSGALGAGGAFVLNPGCVPVRWEALRVSTLALDPAALSLCPEEGGAMLRFAGGRLGGGARASGTTLAGHIGASPLQLTAAKFALGLTRRGFNGTGIEARIGAGPNPVILAAGQLDGSYAPSGLGGRFAQGHGRIASVPLDLGEMAGRWRFAGGRLDVDGQMRVADSQTSAPRFNPVLVPDAHLTLAGGHIAASGHVRHPALGGPFATVTIAHDLGAGAGEARFALQDLRFGDGLQPDDLTPLAQGVVANVFGSVTGGGTIRWRGDRVASTGRFVTEDMNLAAAFGPVQGLSTTLAFIDLLAVETAPGQVARIKSVNPGVEVRDGRVVFQLQRGNRAHVEDGEWPFAGGKLTLLPSTLDFDAKGARHLIFRVTGLDAGAFINTMDLRNISATGTYDGLLPMVFDATGGRIEGGILVARQEGMPPLVVENAQNLTVPCDPARQAGTLSYVGEVSNADMGAYGKLAFDALKKLRYKCLTILLDGAVDGEFVTRVAINGVNQGSEESRRSAILRPFLGIPFLFNVRIEAPFRGLLNTYQSFVDPSALVRGSLGPQYQTVLQNRLAVQPPESDKGVTRNGE